MREYQNGTVVVVTNWAEKINGLSGTVTGWSEKYHEYIIEYPVAGEWCVPEHYVQSEGDLIEAGYYD